MSDAPALLNWADYTIIAIIAISTIISLMRGFVREALSLGVWLGAFFIAFKFSDLISPMFRAYINSDSIRFAAAFALLMVSSLVIGAIISHFLALLIRSTGLSGTDRVLGIVFGLARGVLFVVILLMIGQLSNFQRQPWWTGSKLIPQFSGLVTQLESLLPEKVAQFPAFLESKTRQVQQKARSAIREATPTGGGAVGGIGGNVIEDVKKAIKGGGVGSLPGIIQDQIK